MPLYMTESNDLKNNLINNMMSLWRQRRMHSTILRNFLTLKMMSESKCMNDISRILITYEKSIKKILIWPEILLLIYTRRKSNIYKRPRMNMNLDSQKLNDS